MNKSPGPNSFSNEYYKVFQTVLSPHIAIFEATVSNTSFPHDMLRAYVVSLPKPDKDPTAPSNFRPTSLWNSDVKLYTKLIANRPKYITPNLVLSDQMGFTPPH